MKRNFFFALLFLFSFSAFAGEKLFYLASPFSLQELSPPPKEGSKEDQEDLLKVEEWQKKRTNAQCEAAHLQEKLSFEAVIGKENPFADPLPKNVKKILKHVDHDTRSTVGLFKRHFSRKRPFLRDAARFKPCIEATTGGAYPSGHATYAHVFALLLSDLRPEKREVYMQLADQAALHRVIGGVHHPSDVEQGKKLANAIYARMKKSTKFQKDFDVLKKEMSAPSILKDPSMP